MFFLQFQTFVKALISFLLAAFLPLLRLSWQFWRFVYRLVCNMYACDCMAVAVCLYRFCICHCVVQWRFVHRLWMHEFGGLSTACVSVRCSLALSLSLSRFLSLSLSLALFRWFLEPKSTQRGSRDGCSAQSHAHLGIRHDVGCGHRPRAGSGDRCLEMVSGVGWWEVRCGV